MKEPKGYVKQKLKQCGHVQKLPGEFVKCDMLTSRSYKMSNGSKIPLCPAHAPKN
jgi:hypothetical protein